MYGSTSPTNAVRGASAVKSAQNLVAEKAGMLSATLSGTTVVPARYGGQASPQVRTAHALVGIPFVLGSTPGETVA